MYTYMDKYTYVYVYVYLQISNYFFQEVSHKPFTIRGSFQSGLGPSPFGSLLRLPRDPVSRNGLVLRVINNRPSPVWDLHRLYPVSSCERGHKLLRLIPSSNCPFLSGMSDGYVIRLPGVSVTNVSSEDPMKLTVEYWGRGSGVS